MMYLGQEQKTEVDWILEMFISAIVGAIIGIGIFRSCSSNKYSDNNNIIESLNTANGSIKIKIEKLDSIKNAKVIEVSTLDNDSTLKLFYKLVSE